MAKDKNSDASATKEAVVNDKNTRLREKIQAQIDRTREEQKQKILQRRIELARQGVTLFEQNKIAEAVKNFFMYLRLVEEWKNVKANGLHPSLFDPKKEVAEMLLISAIYWDLARVFDKTASKAKYRDFVMYLDKFVLFTKGMPYQPMCAELLRKYIRNDKPLHKKDVKRAFMALGGREECFIATALFDEVADDTIPWLRVFRDQTLLSTDFGRLLVRSYYRAGPTLSWIMIGMPSPIRRITVHFLNFVANRAKFSK